MRDPFRATLLATAILGAIAATLPLRGHAGAGTADTAPHSYLIRFAEAGIFEALPGTAANRPAPRSPEAAARRAQLMDAQAAHKAAIDAAIGRTPLITHHYLASRSGIAAQLTDAEAERVRQLPGVAGVKADGVEYLATFRSPMFIGADTLWNGSATPDAIGTRGEGMIIGDIDTGITPDHPAFADSPTCADDGLGAKLLSYVDCSTTDEGGRCNGPDPIDHVGHGTHTAATAAGSRVEANGNAPVFAISGVAPCAHLRTYKACPGTSCTFAALDASMDNVLLDGDVDVVNFSIAGGTDPWNDTDRTKLDLVASGVFIAASAGNTNPTQPNPVGRVNHLGPWVMTVAASTQDVWADGLLSVAGPGEPAADLHDIQLYKASASPNLTAHAALPIRHFADQPAGFEGCTPGADGVPADLTPFPAGYFNGAAALLRNANCAPATQIGNARAAGAEVVLIRADTLASNTQLQTDGQADVPSYGIEEAPGDALAAFVDANPAATTIDLAPVQGDALAGFSLRGPTPQMFNALTKPNITAPGVRIYSAFLSDYAYLDGTSMSSPHIAGSAALMRSVHPDWSVPEVISALMTTAKASGVDDTWSQPWNADEVGSGRVDLSAAARAGLVLDESIDAFLAADPDGGSLGVRDLNLASARDLNCTPGCTWIRSVRSTVAEASHWSVAVSASTPGLDIAVTPSEFTLAAGDEDIEGSGDTVFADGFDPSAPGRSQVIAITATLLPGTSGTLAFGDVVLTESGGALPAQHITVAVSGDGGGSGQPDIHVLPAAIDASANGNAIVSRTLVIANNDSGALDWSRISSQTAGNVWRQTASGSAGVLSSQSTTQNGGVYTANDFHLRVPTTLTAIQTPGIDVGNALPSQSAITWAIYADDNGKPAGDPQTNPDAAVWTYTSPVDGAGVTLDGGDIRLDLEAAGHAADLPAGIYWLSVFPTYANNITGSAPHWNWLQATQADLGAQLISPTIYAVTSWSPITSIGVSFTDTAFSLEGRIGGDIDCAASWLQSSPSNGHLDGIGSQAITIRLDPQQLAPGLHTASVCIDSNDPDQPTVIVPVRFTVND